MKKYTEASLLFLTYIRDLLFMEEILLVLQDTEKEQHKISSHSCIYLPSIECFPFDLVSRTCAVKISVQEAAELLMLQAQLWNFHKNS